MESRVSDMEQERAQNRSKIEDMEQEQAQNRRIEDVEQEYKSTISLWQFGIMQYVPCTFLLPYYWAILHYVGGTTQSTTYTTYNGHFRKHKDTNVIESQYVEPI